MLNTAGHLYSLHSGCFKTDSSTALMGANAGDSGSKVQGQPTKKLNPDQCDVIWYTKYVQGYILGRLFCHMNVVFTLFV